jgi:hypothetical protein
LFLTSCNKVHQRTWLYSETIDTKEAVTCLCLDTMTFKLKLHSKRVKLNEPETFLVFLHQNTPHILYLYSELTNILELRNYTRYECKYQIHSFRVKFTSMRLHLSYLRFYFASWGNISDLLRCRQVTRIKNKYIKLHSKRVNNSIRQKQSKLLHTCLLLVATRILVVESVLHKHMENT